MISFKLRACCPFLVLSIQIDYHTSKNSR